MTIDEIMESGFIQDLIKNPKPTFLSYFKKEGPIVTLENKDAIIESLMVDYLFKKAEIEIRLPEYCPKKSDLETLLSFEEMITASLNTRCDILHFMPYDPTSDIKQQIKEVMIDTDFVKWTFI
jgi:hypothetical protein